MKERQDHLGFALTPVQEDGPISVYKSRSGVHVFFVGDVRIAKASTKGAGGCHELTTFHNGKSSGGMSHSDSVKGMLSYLNKWLTTHPV